MRGLASAKEKQKSTRIAQVSMGGVEKVSEAAVFPTESPLATTAGHRH